MRSLVRCPEEGLFDGLSGPAEVRGRRRGKDEAVPPLEVLPLKEVIEKSVELPVTQGAVSNDLVKPGVRCVRVG